VRRRDETVGLHQKAEIVGDDRRVAPEGLGGDRAIVGPVHADRSKKGVLCIGL
jgi:hypothetical protein